MKKIRITLLFYLFFELVGGYLGLFNGPQSLAYAQASLTQTSLSAAVNGPAGYSGTSQSFDTSVTLTSVTGVVAPVNGAIQSALYINKELMGVTAVNTTTKVVQVVRGFHGTQAQPHANAEMVLIGNNNQFYAVDPNGACTAANTLVTPWVNILTGAQWLCSTLTGTWVPGFGNPGTPGAPIALTAAVASVAGTTTPSGPYFHITGTNAITAWGIPVGCDATTAGGCSFTVIPDAAFTTTATNNIATAVTAVANLAQIWTWDATNSKFVVIQSK